MVKNFNEESRDNKILALNLFNELLQNEQQKAFQAVNAFRSGNYFGGTSISSLIKFCEYKEKIEPQSYEELADKIADAYIMEEERIFSKLSNGFISDEIELFKEHGVFYGVHISPKLIGLTECLSVNHNDLLLEGFPDPYNLPNEPVEVVNEYLVELRKQRGIDIELSSIVLADTTTPKGYEGKKILNPFCLNDKLARLSVLIKEAMDSKNRFIDPLYLLSTDTDSPHRKLITERKSPLEGHVLTPGLTMCGSTSKIDGFDFKFAYRLGLVAQSLSNNIVASKINSKYKPFMFVGMLSPFGYVNGAIPTSEMGKLRYEGDIDMKREFEFQYDKCIRKLMN